MASVSVHIHTLRQRALTITLRPLRKMAVRTILCGLVALTEHIVTILCGLVALTEHIVTILCGLVALTEHIVTILCGLVALTEHIVTILCGLVALTEHIVTILCGLVALTEHIVESTLLDRAPFRKWRTACHAGNSWSSLGLDSSVSFYHIPVLFNHVQC